MHRSAHFSSDRNYRYTLARAWDDALPRLTWVLLNPSRASEHEDDPTIRRVIGLSSRWGYGSVLVANLYARVCTCPTELHNNFSERERIGPRNNVHLSKLAAPIVVAWGAQTYARTRALEVLELLPRPLTCIGQNGDGSPKHPLYARRDTPCSPFQPVS
ncbi:MAG: DUF1643 domain-containing protein [bacterium]|nr:DUF1643 domain-containing protein [bacterium]